MSSQYNAAEIGNAVYNGTELDKIVYNGTEVFTKKTLVKKTVKFSKSNTMGEAAPYKKTIWTNNTGYTVTADITLKINDVKDDSIHNNTQATVYIGTTKIGTVVVDTPPKSKTFKNKSIPNGKSVIAQDNYNSLYTCSGSGYYYVYE